MKRYSKSLLALLLTAALCFTLTACGDGFIELEWSEEQYFEEIEISPSTTQAPTTTTRSTTSTTASTQVDNTLSALPSQYADNFFMQAKENGGCKALVGKVTVTVVFVNDPDGKWGYDGMEAAKKTQKQAMEFLRAAATEYGAAFSYTLTYKTATATQAPQLENSVPFVTEALRSAGLPTISTLNGSLKSKYGVDEAPVIFCVNHAGRSFAATGTGAYGEYVVLYNNGNSFAHELLHLFGACDYYFPDSVKSVATSLFKTSIMLDSDTESVDPLTAYLVGWTDKLSSAAAAFLQKTNHITEEMYDEEHSVQTYTGYIENQKRATGVYTGYLVDGVMHGQGTYTWESGDQYAGSWVNGVRSGQGTFTWVSGAKYVGAWANGVQHGKGTLYMPSGDIYEGDWKNGAREGQGTLTWANGAKYVGAWVDNRQHGEGTMTWSNGDTYVGEFTNGKRTGYGTYTWANGVSQTGEWRDGKFIG